MKRSKFSEEQVVYAFRQAESGTPIGDLCRQYGVAEQTFYAWKKKYAHLGVSELRWLRQLKEENSRFKRRVADLSLDKHMLSEALRKKSLRPARRRALAQWFRVSFAVSCAEGAVGWPNLGAHPGTERARPKIRRPCGCVSVISRMRVRG